MWHDLRISRGHVMLHDVSSCDVIMSVDVPMSCEVTVSCDDHHADDITWTRNLARFMPRHFCDSCSWQSFVVWGFSGCHVTPSSGISTLTDILRLNLLCPKSSPRRMPNVQCSTLQLINEGWGVRGMISRVPGQAKDFNIHSTFSSQMFTCC